MELPKTNQVITKEWILQKISEESIFSYYYGESISDKKLYKSKLRTDNRPTCSFHRNKNNILYYHDFATNDNLNCFSYVMKACNCTFPQALQTIASDFGLISVGKITNKAVRMIATPKIEEKEDVKIQIEKQDFSAKELQWWKEQGVSEKTLKKYNIFSCKSIFLNNNFFTYSSQTNPIFGYYGGKKNGNELWRIYFPKKKIFRFLSNWNKYLIQGSKQLPASGDFLVITKSLKDVCALYELGIAACAPCSEALFLNKQQLSKLKTQFKHIIVLYDNDLPGIQGLKRIKKMYPELIYLYIPRKFKSKDISDFIKKHGRTKLQELISTTKNWILSKYREKK